MREFIKIIVTRVFLSAIFIISSLRAFAEPVEGCRNCECLSTAGKIVFQPSQDAATIHQVLVPSCISASLLPPKDKYLANNLLSYIESARPGGPMHACDSEWSRHLTSLTLETIVSSSSVADNETELLSRLREDEYFASAYDMPLDSPSGSTCDLRRTVLAMYVIIRLENAAYLQRLISDNIIENLLRLSDPKIDKALFILTQHAEMFPDLLTIVLSLRKKLFEEETAGDPIAIAGLEDRLSIMETGAQLYGSHTVCEDGQAKLAKPLIDSEQATNTRRHSLGLVALSEFLASRTNTRCNDD